jgi:hypothetical protein
VLIISTKVPIASLQTKMAGQLNKGDDIESTEKYGQTPLSWAAESSEEAVVATAGI